MNYASSGRAVIKAIVRSPAGNSIRVPAVQSVARILSAPERAAHAEFGDGLAALEPFDHV
jgi:hypothetical protein